MSTVAGTTSKEKPKKSKAVGCLVLLGIIFFFVMISHLFNVLKPEGGVPGESSVALKIEGLSVQQEEAIKSVLKEIDVGEVNKVTHDELLDDEKISGYRIDTSYTNNVILYLNSEDKTVNSIRWADNDLYKNGEVVSKLTDFIIPLKEATMYQIYAQDAVKEILKSPSTAKFPNVNGWKMAKKDGAVIIQSYVDSENSFGAKIRSDFQFVIRDGVTESFIFDGKELVSKN